MAGNNDDAAKGDKIYIKGTTNWLSVVIFIALVLPSFVTKSKDFAVKNKIMIIVCMAVMSSAAEEIYFDWIMTGLWIFCTKFHNHVQHQ